MTPLCLVASMTFTCIIQACEDTPAASALLRLLPVTCSNPVGTEDGSSRLTSNWTRRGIRQQNCYKSSALQGLIFFLASQQTRVKRKTGTIAAQIQTVTPPSAVDKLQALCAGAQVAVQCLALTQALTLPNYYTRAWEVSSSRTQIMNKVTSERDFNQCSCTDTLQTNWEGLPAFISDYSPESITFVSLPTAFCQRRQQPQAVVLKCLVLVMTLPQATFPSSLPYCLWDTSHSRFLSGQRLAWKLSFVESVFGDHFLWSIFGIQNVVNSMCEQQLPSPPAPVSDIHVGCSGGHLVCFCPSDPG